MGARTSFLTRFEFETNRVQRLIGRQHFGLHRIHKIRIYQNAKYLACRCDRYSHGHNHALYLMDKLIAHSKTVAMKPFLQMEKNPRQRICSYLFTLKALTAIILGLAALAYQGNKTRVLYNEIKVIRDQELGIVI